MSGTTNAVHELDEQGLKPGDRAWNAELIYATPDEPCWRREPLGLFKAKATAKKAVERAMTRATTDGLPDGWWTGEIEPGVIAAETWDDADYGRITDWGWESDERGTVEWLWEAGEAWQ